MELLSPAGSMECLVAAVQNGADAVYFGGGSFNARRYANNFVGDGLARAVDYCHERGVRAYITLNTLVFNREIPDALDFAAELYRLSVDAVLVQDLGLAAVIRRCLPELTIHASTQMGIHDLGGLNYCKSIGITRAVLARETSLDQIRYLAKNSDIEIETFAHGALCMSFSGSCLYSSMSGERSGNRGTCAQPCRKRASVSGRPGMTDFCLSPNDICMIEQLDVLKKAGVACVKLEGRMKKPEYVAHVTRCYRAALEGASEREILKLKGELFELFNRGNFNTAHLVSDSVRTDRIASSKPSKELVRSAEMSMQGENRKMPSEMELVLEVGKPAELKIRALGQEISAKGAFVQRANKTQSEENYRERLKKLGDTPLEMVKCDIEFTTDCYISAAELNALRRDAVKMLLESCHRRNVVPEYRYENNESGDGRNIKEADKTAGNKLKYVHVQTAEHAALAFENGADLVAIEPVFWERQQFEPLKKYREEGKKLLLALPNVIITGEQNKEAAELLKSGLFDGAEANNIGQVELLFGEKVSALEVLIAGIGLNALNRESMAELIRLGFNYIIPSPELTAAQMSELAEEYSDVILINIHGRVPLMQLVHCPIKEHGGCRKCKGLAGKITDEALREFPLVNTRFKDKCLVRMLNCNTTDLIDLYAKLPETAGFMLSFIAESENAIEERLGMLSMFQNAFKGENNASNADVAFTRGHWNRKVE